jgi:hypothetical protein
MRSKNTVSEKENVGVGRKKRKSIFDAYNKGGG